MSEDSHNLRLLALLNERVVQHDALVLEESIPAHADSHLRKLLSVWADLHMVQRISRKSSASARGDNMSTY